MGNRSESRRQRRTPSIHRMDRDPCTGHRPRETGRAGQAAGSPRCLPPNTPSRYAANQGDRNQSRVRFSSIRIVPPKCISVRTPRNVLTVVGAGALLACGAVTGCSPSSPTTMHPRHETAPATVPQDSTVRSAATPKGLVPGVDVSAYQPHVNWTSVNAEGARFAYVKATEGVKYKSSTFTAQYTGARNAGLAHGAYHFATPNTASGIAQADYFVAHGCYGMSHAKMNSWITAFLHEHRARTGRHAVINTFRDWWIACTGNAGAKSGSTFGATYLLWVNEHKASAANVPVPSAWKSYTVWQWTDSHSPSENVYALDTDLFCARRRSHTCGHFSRYRGDLHPIGRTLAIKGKSIFEQRVRGSAPIDRLRGIWAVRGALHSARSRPDRRDRAAGCPAVSGISVADSVERTAGPVAQSPVPEFRLAVPGRLRRRGMHVHGTTARTCCPGRGTGSAPTGRATTDQDLADLTLAFRRVAEN